MASLKFFLVASVLVACAAAQVIKGTEQQPTQGETTTRNKKDVLLSTYTYPYVQPYVQPSVPLLRTFGTVGTVAPVAPVSAVTPIHSYYRTVYPYSSHYPYSYYPYYPSIYYKK